MVDFVNDFRESLADARLTSATLSEDKILTFSMQLWNDETAELSFTGTVWCGFETDAAFTEVEIEYIEQLEQSDALGQLDEGSLAKELSNYTHFQLTDIDGQPVLELIAETVTFRSESPLTPGEATAN